MRTRSAHPRFACRLGCGKVAGTPHVFVGAENRFVAFVLDDDSAQPFSQNGPYTLGVDRPKGECTAAGLLQTFRCILFAK